MARTNFENLRVYQLSEEIADLTWEIVVKWKRLAQDTVGKQAALLCHLLVPGGQELLYRKLSQLHSSNPLRVF